MESIIIFLVIGVLLYSVMYIFGIPITERIRKKENFNKLHGNSKVAINPNFQKIYSKISSNSLYQELDKFQTSAESKFLIGFFSYLIITLGYISLVKIDLIPILIFTIVFLLYFCLIFLPAYKIFKSTFKSTVIIPLVENISPTLKYTQNDGSPTEEAYKASTLETGFYNKYISDDYMYGSINGINFNLTNIHTQHEKKSDIGKLVTHLFNGIFIYSYTKTNIDFDFKILNRKFIYATPNFEVNLPNSKFNRYFRLYAENQDAVVDTLNAELINLITNFMDVYGVPFDLSVTDNGFNFRFYTGTSFESHLFKKSNNLYTLNMYYSIIEFTITFIETFKRYHK